MLPIAVFHEHPEWFRPRLAGRGLPHDPLAARADRGR